MNGLWAEKASTFTSGPSRIIVTSLMFVGRLGPLAFGISLFLSRKALMALKDEDVAI